MAIKAPVKSSKVQEIPSVGTPYTVEILHVTPDSEHGNYLKETNAITPFADHGCAHEVRDAEKSRARLPGTAQFNPCNLLDALIKILGVKNDAGLARTLEISPPIISRIRRKKIAISGTVLLRMHEVSELSIFKLRFLMDDLGPLFRPGIK